MGINKCRKKGPAIKIHPFSRSIFLGQKISNIAYPACNLDEISENLVRAVDRYYIIYIYFHYILKLLTQIIKYNIIFHIYLVINLFR